MNFDHYWHLDVAEARVFVGHACSLFKVRVFVGVRGLSSHRTRAFTRNINFLSSLTSILRITIACEITVRPPIIVRLCWLAYNFDH